MQLEIYNIHKQLTTKMQIDIISNRGDVNAGR